MIEKVVEGITDKSNNRGRKTHKSSYLWL